jgi:pilus assembly protein CpaC
MHHTNARTETWIASTILALLFSFPSPSPAQEPLLDFGGDQDQELEADQVLPVLQAPEPAEPSDPTLDEAPQEITAPEAAPETAEPEGDPSLVSIRKLTLVVGQSKTLALSDLAKRVVVDNPGLVDPQVNKKNPKEVILSALKPGIAEIMVTDRAGRRHRIEVMVTPDATPLQKILSEMYPNANIQVVPATDQSVAVIGQVENPQAVGPIMEIAKQFYAQAINGIQVVGPQQVQLRVMLAEVSRTKLRALGFNFLHGERHNGEVSYFASTIGGLLTISTSNSSVSGLGFNFNPDNNIVFGKLQSNREFRGFVRALKEEGLAKILAEPTLVTFSGRAANMIIGGEYPIIVPGQQGTFTVEFRDYGNKLDFVPIVLGGGRIRLEVRPELSELDYANGVNFQGFTVPGIKQRRIDTSVELHTGETFVIGGLLSTTDSANTSKVPYIGDVAIIGAAFRTMSYSQEERELIIMVTPELVEPMKPGQKPCAYPGSESTHPTDHELFLLGNVEAPVCSECETPRRNHLMPGNWHTRPALPPCDTMVGVGGKLKVDVTAKTAKGLGSGNGASRAPQAQSPSVMTGLLGPLGYEGGR